MLVTHKHRTGSRIAGGRKFGDYHFFGEFFGILFPLLVTLLAGTGCEQIVESPDLPYVERIVVTGVLEADSTEPLLLFTRTLPLDRPLLPAQAGLSDVQGIIVADGREYPLEHTEVIGVYRAVGLLVIPGKVYELHAEWHGKRVYASTYVPHPMIEATSSLEPFPIRPGEHVTLRTTLRPRPGEVYTQTWAIVDTSGVLQEGGVFRHIARLQNAGVDGWATISDSYSHFPLSSNDTVYAVIHTFDEQYYAYFNSRGNIEASAADDIFVFSGTVKWNVKGDGIGLFIGRAQSRVRIPT